MTSETFNVGIIGFGPKGFYGFERLLAELNTCKSKPKIAIHIYNETDAFATGWIYDVNQPDFLVMNYPNQHISLKPKKEPAPILPILTFTEWQSKKTGNSIAFEKTNIAARKDVGEYLKFYFEELCSHIQKDISIYSHISTVTGIQKMAKGYHLKTNKTQETLLFDSLLITTGHTPAIVNKLETRSKSKFSIPFVYPFNKTIKHVKPKSVVACKGIGLTAIDTILALTEGKGGSFKTHSDSTLSYEKSGFEPQTILPFSRSGLPIVPRGTQTLNLKQTGFYLKKFVQKLSKNSPRFDFENDILPIIKQDLVASYYHCIFKLYAFEFSIDSEFEKLQKAITRFHENYPDVKMFSPEDLFNPKLNRQINQNVAIKNYLNFWIHENSKESSPFVAAASAWRFLVDDFNFLYRNNWLTQDSKIKFQKKYFGLFNRISYGPPITNIRKLLALVEANILDFSFSKSPSILQNNSTYTIQLKNQTKDFDYLIDARLPRGFTQKTSVFFNKPLENDLFSLQYKSETYSELKCTPEGNPLNRDGKKEKEIVLYGTPTEETLFDNDTLSRSHNDTASQWAKNTVAQVLLNENCITL